MEIRPWEAALMLTALGTTKFAFASSSPPPPPPGPHAYVAMIANPERSAQTPGTTWYWQSALTLDGLGVSLDKAAVQCLAGYWTTSSDHAGRLVYRGFLKDGPDGPVAHLQLRRCSDCEGSHVPVPENLELSIQLQATGVAVVAGEKHTQGLSSSSFACPEE
jgi:hypothetical protein